MLPGLGSVITARSSISVFLLLPSLNHHLPPPLGGHDGERVRVEKQAAGEGGNKVAYKLRRECNYLGLGMSGAAVVGDMVGEREARGPRSWVWSIV